jgi:hypothetical protein
MRIQTFAPKVFVREPKGGWLYGAVASFHGERDYRFATQALGENEDDRLNESSVWELPRSIVEEFADLERSEEEAGRFLSNYGLFRLDDIKLRKDVPRAIRPIWKPGKDVFAMPIAEFWDAQTRLRHYLRIVTEFRAGVWTEQGQAAAKALGYPAPRAALEREIRKQMARGIAFGLRFDSPQQIQPLIRTLAVLPGIHAHVWNALVEGHPYVLCARCERVFRQDRPGKQFCSPACQGAAKQQRYRDRKVSR